MLQLILLSLILMILSSFMILLNFFISKKTLLSREKISPFECGFDPMSFSHSPFSIHFFLISLIFLIFDIEITLLIPLVPMMFSLNLHMILTSFLFLIILILGLYIEYTEQSIDWKL